MPDVDYADEFFDVYRALRVRLAPFRLKTDFETRKTVGMIDALLNRADTVHAGAFAGGRFGVTAGHNEKNYLDRCERYLSALERGEFPLKGLFAEPGMNFVDHTFIEKDGVMHVFYNRSDIGFEWDTRFVDTVGHATSTDMVHWHPETPVLALGNTKYENYQIWSPGVAEKDGVYYMYYTSVNRDCAQSISLAISRDLYTWEKYADNPVVLPGAWGTWEICAWSDCRDAHALVEADGTAYLYYCSRLKDGTPVLGVSESSDMVSFTDRGAYSFEFCKEMLESPFVTVYDGKYYLFYTNCGEGTCYAVSDDPISGWHGGGLLIPKRGAAECAANVPSCAEAVCFKGEWYISCCDRQPGNEQYLELYHLLWRTDGTPALGEQILIEEV